MKLSIGFVSANDIHISVQDDQERIQEYIDLQIEKAKVISIFFLFFNSVLRIQTVLHRILLESDLISNFF